MKSNVRSNLEIIISVNKFSFSDKILLFDLCVSSNVSQCGKTVPRPKWFYDLLQNFYIYFLSFFRRLYSDQLASSVLNFVSFNDILV